MSSYVFLFAAIFATAFGQFFYKKFTLTKNNVYYLLTIVLFLLAPIFSFLALEKISIDIVYVFTALTVFIVMLLSRFLLNEQIYNKTYYGVGLIILGVLIYAI